MGVFLAQRPRSFGFRTALAREGLESNAERPFPRATARVTTNTTRRRETTATTKVMAAWPKDFVSDQSGGLYLEASPKKLLVSMNKPI